MNKIRSHLHIFSKKKLIFILNLHHPFVATESTAWIFFTFRPSKIRIIPTGVVSFLFPLRCCLYSSWRCHAIAPCHTYFSWTQDVLAASASSSDNASSRRLPSRAKSEAFNPHHRCWSPSPDSLTRTLYCYKKSSQHWSLSPPFNRVSILPPP
jgi:hypothetical protein